MQADTEAITGAISALEKFPMTKALLQTTRIGKVLNDVRKLTVGQLPSRIKSIIRAWQVLLQESTKSDTIVIPSKSLQNGVSSRGASPFAGGTLTDSAGPTKSGIKRVNGSSVSLSSLGSLHREKSSPRSNSGSLSNNFVDRNNQKKSNCSPKKRQHALDNHLIDSDSRSPPNKYPRLGLNDKKSLSQPPVHSDNDIAAVKDDSAKTQSAALVTSGESNSASSTYPKLRIRFGGNGKTTTTSLVTNASGKVADSIVNVISSPTLNSIAKSVQIPKKDIDAGGDTLSAVSGSTNKSSRPPANPSFLPRVKSTAELLNQYGKDMKTHKKIDILEMEREPDVVPSVLPVTARPRRLRPVPTSSVRDRTKLQPSSFVPSSSQDLFGIDSPAVGSAFIMEKFLASAAETERDSNTYAVVNSSAATGGHVTSPSISAPSQKVSPTSTSKPGGLSPKTKLDFAYDAKSDSTTNEVIGDESESRRKHKHKHKHKHKEKHKNRVNITHPVTNLMDQRPGPLPPLPDVDPAKYPYPHPRPVEVTEKSINRLLHDDWPGMNCTVKTDSSETVPYTEMYTIHLDSTTNDPHDSTLHLLPWVELNGWRRQYFPDDALKLLDEFQLVKPR